jgi:hypothetical protein
LPARDEPVDELPFETRVLPAEAEVAGFLSLPPVEALQEEGCEGEG